MHTIFHIYNIPQCEQINSDAGRLYKTPDGNLYPSVTTVLSSYPNPHLDEWIEKVGKVRAQQYANAAASRGTKIHEWCETYVKGLDPEIPSYEFEAGNMFKQMRPELEKFQEVHALENRLWSDKLRVAGTVDCIATIDDELYIVDFKTSTRYKTREDIPTYFMQCAAYAVAWYERTGMAVGKMRVLITTQDDGVLVYDEPVKRWVPKFMELRKTYDLL